MPWWLAVLIGLGLTVVALTFVWWHRKRMLETTYRFEWDYGFEVWVSWDGGQTWEMTFEADDFVEACDESLHAGLFGCHTKVVAATTMIGDDSEAVD